ncbi:hypothetical protein Nepgr_023730 [Nepenthes gracilis]|uniref:TF-B3 domain-containing protein n=1 Tax=Nepenthes gracilis TaxID=150966 RepID=A0AAD3T4G0_NEPGR|nr:hypothetical protein Nepgr_023730 [Nepenthes gracilis]
MSLPLPVKITSSQDVVLAALTLFLIKDGEFDPSTTLNKLEKSKAQRCLVKRLASKSSSTAAASTASLRQQRAPPRNAMPPITFNESTRSFGSYPPQQLPPIKGLVPALIAECSEPFEKQLTKSDVCPGQARLALINEYAGKLLIPKLRAWERLEDGIEVMTYGLEGKQYEMIFKSWRSRLGKKMVVLTKGWKGFCEDHKLKMDQDFVTVWMFRRTDADGLCFAVVSRRLSNVRHRIRRAARSREINAGMAEESTTAKRLRRSEDD